MKEKAQKTEEIRHLDETDRRILNILSDNARTKLTEIARHINLSVDSTKKRIQKLEKDGIIDKYTILPNSYKIGIGLGIHVYLKLKDIEREKYDEMMEELKKNPRVITLKAMLGDYDVYIVLLAKDTLEMEKMRLEIRQKFGAIIGEWKEIITSRIYKLEEYKF